MAIYIEGDEVCKCQAAGPSESVHCCKRPLRDPAVHDCGVGHYRGSEEGLGPAVRNYGLQGLDSENSNMS